MLEFHGQSLIKFSERFSDDLSCKKYLADIKWNNGFKCVKCGHTKYSMRNDYTRTCTFCHHNESPTSNTAFHKVKFGLKKAFFITFEMVNSTKSLSASQVAKRYEITRKTAWLFMHKIRKVMESSKNLRCSGFAIPSIFNCFGLRPTVVRIVTNPKQRWVVTTYAVRDFQSRTYSIVSDYALRL